MTRFQVYQDAPYVEFPRLAASAYGGKIVQKYTDYSDWTSETYSIEVDDGVWNTPPALTIVEFVVLTTGYDSPNVPLQYNNEPIYDPKLGDPSSITVNFTPGELSYNNQIPTFLRFSVEGKFLGQTPDNNTDNWLISGVAIPVSTDVTITLPKLEWDDMQYEHSQLVINRVVINGGYV